MLRGNEPLRHPHIPCCTSGRNASYPALSWVLNGKCGGIAASEISGGKLIPGWQPDPLHGSTGLNFSFLTGRVKRKLRRKKENPKIQINLEVSSDFAEKLAD